MTFLTLNRYYYTMKKYILPIVIITISILLSAIFYKYLPNSMASHWNAQGVVDGYSSKTFNILMFPVLLIVLFILLITIPRIDPKKKNIEKFQKYFLSFINIILIFIILIQSQIFLWNIGIHMSTTTIMPILMGILFIFIAQLLKNAKQNYTIGIRTPWTLASEKVWDKTHKLGGILFTVSGGISILSVLLPHYSFYILIGSILLSTIYLFVYSYLEYKKEQI